LTYCNNCGKVLKEGAKFCTYCGHTVGQAVTSQPPQFISVPEKKGKIIIKGTGMTTLYKVIAYFIGVFILDLFISWAITAGLKGGIACFWGFVGALYVPLLILTPLLAAIGQSY